VLGRKSGQEKFKILQGKLGTDGILDLLFLAALFFL
jgi:hypothetical protein